MDYELVVVQGRSITSTIKLGEGVTTIGRQDDCQLRIKSSQVSRKHCELFEKKGLLLVKDLGSSNGTLVNGKRIQGQRVLEPGDELGIGPIQLRVVKAGASATAASSKPVSSASDTAVTPAITPAGEGDDFTVDFDEPTEAVAVAAPAAPKSKPKPSPKAKAPAQDEDAIADFLMDLPIEGDEEEEAPTKPTPQPAATAPKSDPKIETVKAAAEPVPEVEEEKGKQEDKDAPDDAIADFLLDIKIDEE